MLTSIFEARPGRTKRFFSIFRNVALLLMGPTAALQFRYFESSATASQAVIVATAIYAEAVLFSLTRFIDTVRFWRLWRTRYLPRAYSRQLKGLRFPEFIIPVHEANTGVQVIRRRHYAFVTFLAILCAAVLCIPVIVLATKGVTSTAESAFMTIALFILVTVGASVNIVAGLIFLGERLANQGLLQIRDFQMLIIISVLYVFWLVFESVNVLCTAWVYTSSDPALRALANVYLFKVTPDTIVSTKEQHSGQIDVGKLYVNMRSCYGTAKVTVDTAPVTQEVLLGEVSRLS